MKKIWKIMILCMILCFFCAGCSNDDEMISEDHPKPTTEKEAIGPGSDKTKPMVSSGTEGVVTKRTEYQVNLEVSLKLKSALIARGYDVYMIRETNDVSLSNKKRALMANESGSDILLRIHCNSADSQSANGALTMSPTLSNPYCRSMRWDLCQTQRKTRSYRTIIINQCLQKELQMVLTGITREEEKRMKKNELS